MDLLPWLKRLIPAKVLLSRGKYSGIESSYNKLMFIYFGLHPTFWISPCTNSSAGNSQTVQYSKDKCCHPHSLSSDLHGRDGRVYALPPAVSLLCCTAYVHQNYGHQRIAANPSTECMVRPRLCCQQKLPSIISFPGMGSSHDVIAVCQLPSVYLILQADKITNHQANYLTDFFNTKILHLNISIYIS